MYYQVGDQTFTNKYLAANHAVNTRQEMHFNLYESAFDRADWSKEPEESWESLLDKRAQQIANKNRPIVLYFSGGTDSYKIYKVFERNNVHIDIIYLRRRLGTMDHALHGRVLELFDKGVYDPTTKIIVRDDDESLFAEAYSTPDWIWTNNIRLEFGVGFTGDMISNAYLARILGRDDFIGVIGYEKPRITINHTGVYSYQGDLQYHRIMESPNADCFYISPELPELHIKQSYMLAKFIRKLRPLDKPKDLTQFSENVADPNKFDWNMYSTACGRGDELSISGEIHRAWAGMEMRNSTGKLDDFKHTGPGDHWFKSLQGTKTVNNYLNGLMSLRNDPTGQFLLNSKENLYSLRLFTSKPYRLNNSILTNY
jgi:hypothetical protein